jgi:hypothetical protein
MPARSASTRLGVFRPELDIDLNPDRPIPATRRSVDGDTLPWRRASARSPQPPV